MTSIDPGFEGREGHSALYADLEDWVEGTIAQTGDMCKHNGIVYKAAFYSDTEPGHGDPTVNGWRMYDEMYDITSTTPQPDMKVIGYLPTWHEGFAYDNPDLYSFVTHVIISFLMFEEDGSFSQTSIDEVKALLLTVENTIDGFDKKPKIMVACGGATDENFYNILKAVSDDESSPLLTTVLNSITEFVTSNRLDGVDLDLECWWFDEAPPESTFPREAGKGLTTLISALKNQSICPDMDGKIVSTAVFGTSWYGREYSGMQEADWISVMSYDFTGSWNSSPVGPHSATYKIKNMRDFLCEQQGPWPSQSEFGKSMEDSVKNMADNPINTVEDSVWYWTSPSYSDWTGPGQARARAQMCFGIPTYGYDFAYKKDVDEQSGEVPPGYRIVRNSEMAAIFPDAFKSSYGNYKELGGTPRPDFVGNSETLYKYKHNIHFSTPETALTTARFLSKIGCQGMIFWDLVQECWDDDKSVLKAVYKNFTK
ncbi:unnamed protein product [Agarophyton chilense]